jgi:hypothetical protein
LQRPWGQAKYKNLNLNTVSGPVRFLSVPAKENRGEYHDNPGDYTESASRRVIQADFNEYGKNDEFRPYFFIFNFLNFKGKKP